MPLQSVPSEVERRTGTTLYLRGDLKAHARAAACQAGQALSRHIESLLLEEIARHAAPLDFHNLPVHQLADYIAQQASHGAE